jgi:hypothetical protein
MLSKSIIEKGKRFEKMIAKDIEAEGLGMARRETGSGSGLKKGDIASNLPFMIEAKNQKTICIQKWIRQAKEQARIGNYNPNKWALVFKDPATPEANPEVYAVIDFYEFLKLLKKDKEPIIKEQDREIKWKLQRLIESAKAVIKDLD